jgi:hypothetical protein
MNATTSTPPAASPRPDRLVSVNLTDLSDEKMSALRRVAIERGVSLCELFADFIDAAAARLVSPRAHHNPTDPDGLAAYASGRGLEMPKPEGSN